MVLYTNHIVLNSMCMQKKKQRYMEMQWNILDACLHVDCRHHHNQNHLHRKKAGNPRISISSLTLGVVDEYTIIHPKL